MKETLQLDQFNTNSGGRRANEKPDLFMASSHTHDDNAYMRLLLISWNVFTLMYHLTDSSCNYDCLLKTAVHPCATELISLWPTTTAAAAY